MFRVEKTRVALIESTTHGLGIAASVIPLKDGDNVLVADSEFLQVPLPWKMRPGVNIKPVKAKKQGNYSVDDFAKAMDDRTRVICVSTVQWCSGYRMDTPELARLCRDKGVWLVAGQDLCPERHRVNIKGQNEETGSSILQDVTLTGVCVPWFKS